MLFQLGQVLTRINEMNRLQARGGEIECKGVDRGHT